MRTASLIAIALSAALALVGCGSDPEPEDTTPDASSVLPDAGTGEPDAGATEQDAGPTDPPPTVKILEPAAYAGVVTQIEIKVEATDDDGVAKIELFVGDNPSPIRGRTAAPWELTLDPAGLDNGLTTFYVRATDTGGNTAQTEPQPILFAKGGRESSFTGSLVIPANYDPASGLDVDSKHHWTSEGEANLASVIAWQVPDGQEPWELELSVGWGECPHSGGTIGNAETSTTSPLFVSAVEAGPYATTMRFVHVRPADATFHKGETLPYEIKVYVW